MKLETAQRKLWPHRRRWQIKIEPCTYNSDVNIEATYDGLLHESLSEFKTVRVCATGLAVAMAKMADKLAPIDAAIRAIKEAKRR